MKPLTTLRLGIVLFSAALLPSAVYADRWESSFQQPPASARPWVYWFWLNGNISSNGITADLEAMKRAGIGGVLIMEVDQGAPVGPVDFMSGRWRDLFKHVHHEARRLGLEVNMNDDAGWNGSGGPWIKPAQSMQKIVYTETNLVGPAHFTGLLPQPETVAGYYEDISLVAFPKVGAYRIENIKAKAAYETSYVGPAAENTLARDQVIDRKQIRNLHARMDAQGRLTWEVPEGEWTVLRLGHTSTGIENAPAPASGRGLECDKLGAAGIEANFNGMMARLAVDTGLKPGQLRPGLVATHIDSWENGSQNWTARMREEFRQRRGYDLFDYLPVFSGRVVDTLEISERFLWDLRRTISELVVERYAGRMRELAHAHGLRFTVEAYGSPCDVIPYAGEGDEPMGEFWSPSGAMETCRGMASAAHVYGKPIIGAEAFTAGDQERWREHPGVLKALGDRAFCEGINRFVFHRYALQPWPGNPAPGMMMGPWGQHYERTETWWEMSPAWHEYLARCQFLLRQGHFAADLLYLQAEYPPHGVGEYRRAGYAWDECGREVVLNRMSVKDGRIVLPDSMHYRLLVLPDTPAMTPALLAKLKELVASGATVLGNPPRKSPSLDHYPECDQEVQRLAAELWRDCDGRKVKSRAFGKGKVLRGVEPEQALRNAGVPEDFTSGVPLRWIHRTTDKTDLYFVANPSPAAIVTTATFRVADRVPELWWPDSGRTERAKVYGTKSGLTTVALPLGPSASVFVVFRQPRGAEDPVVRLTSSSQEILSAEPRPVQVLIKKAIYGVLDDPQRSHDVRDQVQRRVDASETSFPVRLMAEGGDPAPGQVKSLAVDYEIDGHAFSAKAQDDYTIHLNADHVAVTVKKAVYGVLDDPKRTRDVRAKLQRLLDAGETAFPVARMADGDDPAFLVVKTLIADCEINGKPVTLRGTDPEILDVRPEATSVEPAANVRAGKGHRQWLEAYRAGHYELQTAAGKNLTSEVTEVPEPEEVLGGWRVAFPSRQGAPLEAAFDRLISWPDHADAGIKYFSGTATYSKTLSLAPNRLSHGRKLYLDLGRVEVMARVKLNGKDLGILWKRPYRVDITSAARAGDNRLEVQVANLWPNRLVGDELLPEDSDRNPDGTLKSWPAWVLEGKVSPSGRQAFPMWRLWKKTDTLLPSGLIGPVKLQSSQLAELKF